MRISVVIPARNEASSLRILLPRIRALGLVEEIVVVDDGSTDETGEVCQQNGVLCVRHPYSRGNGAAETAFGTSRPSMLIWRLRMKPRCPDRTRLR
jgi:glycosyltransferase involved in cell wall biosynthesis